jgi:outer membrane protein TolC
MRLFTIPLLTLVFCSFVQAVAAQKTFSSLDELLRYAAAKSISLQLGDIRLQQAKKAKIAAVLSIPDVSGNASFSYTNNTKLPVNLFPAETFGGEPGTYREVQTGIQYVSNLNENIDIKLLNPKGWENLKLAKLNIEATSSDNQLTLKNLQENIAGTYFNIINLQEQRSSTALNLYAADTILKVTRNKYRIGIAKQQDVNDAEVNYLNTAESLHQIEFLLTQQYLALKINCDIQATDSITINQKINPSQEYTAAAADANFIAVKNSLLKEQAAYSSYKQNKYALYPTVSFFQSYSTQQYNTRGKLFDNNVRWIPSNHVGLRLSIPIPAASAITQVSRARYDYLLAQKNTAQLIIKSALELKQLSVEYDKAISQAIANNKIFRLREDTYQKNFTLYKEGLLSLDQTLSSFAAMVNSHYGAISSTVTALLAKAKIDINNTLK